MEEDKRMIELLTDMVFELKALREGQEKLTTEVTEMKLEITEMKSDLHRNTNAMWEQSQMLQKVIWEPAQQQAKRLSELEERVKFLEQAH